MFLDNGVESFHLLAIACCRSVKRLDIFLPTTVKEQPLLRGIAKIALVPFAVRKHAELLHEFAYKLSAFRWNRNVVGGPGIGRNLICAGSRVAANFALHLKQHEVAEAFLIESPGRREARDPTSHNDD